MTQETRTEVVVFTGLAAFLGALWWLNRNQGGGTGLESLPAFGGDGTLPALAGNGDTNFDIGGDNYTGPSFANGLGATGTGSCCSACSTRSGMVAFGSQNDLLNFLSQTTDPAALLQAAQNWT